MTGPEVLDEDALVSAAVADLDSRLPSVPKSSIERTARRIVHWRLARARILPLVGIIATRQAREELDPDLPVGG